MIKKELYCDSCSLQFESKYIYDTHMRIMHSTNSANIKVEENTINQEAYKSTVMKQQPNLYECAFCPESFPVANNLPTHFQSQHAKTDKTKVHDVIFILKPGGSKAKDIQLILRPMNEKSKVFFAKTMNVKKETNNQHLPLNHNFLSTNSNIMQEIGSQEY